MLVALGQTTATCPPGFSADLCAKRAALVQRLTTFSVAGIHPIDEPTAEHFANDLLASIQSAASSGAKPYVIGGAVVALLAAAAAVGIGLGASRRCRESCGAGLRGAPRYRPR